jgi:hypothetical protein
MGRRSQPATWLIIRCACPDNPLASCKPACFSLLACKTTSAWPQLERRGESGALCLSYSHFSRAVPLLSRILCDHVTTLRKTEWDSFLDPNAHRHGRYTSSAANGRRHICIGMMQLAVVNSVAWISLSSQPYATLSPKGRSHSKSVRRTNADALMCFQGCLMFFRLTHPERHQAVIAAIIRCSAH